jgi:cyclase
MSNTIRIIPRLDIKGPNLVKGIHLEGIRVLGKPERFARFYYENGADELIFMDAVASLYGRNSLLDIIKKTAKEIFIPLTVGGGVRSIDDIRQTLRAGADKVSLNTAAIRRPNFIKEASEQFGSSTIVLSIEAKKMPNDTYEAYTDNGREKTGIDVFEWAKKTVELGAGEIMITSIDREGTGKGFDIDLTRKVAELVPIPVIACGGAGNGDHVYEAIAEGKVDAVSAASLFHYNFLKFHDHSKDSFIHSDAGGVQWQTISLSRIKDMEVLELKKYLMGKGVECRYEEKIKDV